MHDSYTALGGGTAMVNMMLGETAPGGVGSGLYGMLVLAIIAVFVAGLMVGRTPEYLGKKIGPREIKLVSLYILTTPVLVLLGTALSFAIPGVRADVEATSIWNPGLHGFGEVLYAFTSAANNNGSAFAGLTANTPWFNTALGVAMLLGRFLPIVFVLALAGSFAAQDKLPVTAGTLATHRPQFVGLHLGAVLIVSALTYFPSSRWVPWRKGCCNHDHFDHPSDGRSGPSLGETRRRVLDPSARGGAPGSVPQARPAPDVAQPRHAARRGRCSADHRDRDQPSRSSAGRTATLLRVSPPASRSGSGSPSSLRTSPNRWLKGVARLKRRP